MGAKDDQRGRAALKGMGLGKLVEAGYVLQSVTKYQFAFLLEQPLMQFSKKLGLVLQNDLSLCACDHASGAVLHASLKRDEQ